MNLRLYDEQDYITSLGPGVRYGIWTQGCKRRCPGCMTPESWDLSGGYLSDTRALAQRIINSGRDGITISGGEPFLQSESLTDVIVRVRQIRDIGVILYTGFTIQELKKMEKSVQTLLEQCDLLIDGEYMEELNDGKSLRGSSNQNIIPLSERYLDYLDEYGSNSVRIEFFVRENSACMVGISSKEMLEKLKQIKFSKLEEEI